MKTLIAEGACVTKDRAPGMVIGLSSDAPEGRNPKAEAREKTEARNPKSRAGRLRQARV
ncbi:MAG TPA: hypothetical protein VFE51_29625 [Verrucomicrobiae bacterium]|nr:hypothetical protein [Verrucomicrobiae bacterium]